MIQAAAFPMLRGLVKVAPRFSVISWPVLEGRLLELFMIKLVALPANAREQFPVQSAPELEKLTSDGRSI